MHPAEHEKLQAEDGSADHPIAGDASLPTTVVRIGPPTGPPDDDMLLTSKQTRDRCGGVTTMCLWRWQRDPRVQFPAPIKINNRNYWTLGDLRRWQQDRAAASSSNPPSRVT